MRNALGGDRVYDVIGEILSLNKVDLAEILSWSMQQRR